MKEKQALEAFSALSNATRLEVFRYLIKMAPDAVPAGDIAREVEIPASTMSTQLAILSRAGLITPIRSGRVVGYKADIEGVRALLNYLVRDCCRGKPEVCSNLIKAVLPDCC
ncbi:ArsR/SmtB family transcription factor [Dongia soli]|uniref:Helix-turn-helix domain-containing protein n=1 Tax=Dongia soli TaxID=600628 RepID=A0ABU5EI52_9PROT|nr:helix-turn-helix domain-containing protein [Dongia soli]MDY0885185.1 helix-turn-helix domain-containing protein [Dongia soli]